MFWEFARVLREMRDEGRAVPVVLLENTLGWATSKGGDDLRAAVAELNDLGYWCDLLVVNAQRFVPQSRPRLFVVCSREPLAEPGDWRTTDVRPAWVRRFVEAHPELRMQALDIVPPPTIASIETVAPPPTPSALKLPRILPRWSTLCWGQRSSPALPPRRSRTLSRQPRPGARHWRGA